jgi:hypothetical protein
MLSSSSRGAARARLKGSLGTGRPLLAALGATLVLGSLGAATASAAADTQAPSAPSTLAAAAGSGKVGLTWKASTDNVGVKGYHVWRRATAGSTWSNVGTAATSGYSDATVTNGTAYTYSVRAYDAAGNTSASSNTVSATPSASAPTPTPAPTDGSVLWRADGEQSLVNEWAEYSTGPNCAVTSDTVGSDPRVTRTTSNVAKGAGAYAFTVNDGDNCYGERAEIGQALPSRTGFSESRLFNNGDDRWISFQVKLGSDFPLNTTSWNLIAQWKHLVVPNSNDVYPEVAVEVHNGRYYLDDNGSAAWAGPAAVANRWQKFTLHMKFSNNPSVGFVEVYGDPDGAGLRQLMPRRYMRTLGQNTSGVATPGHSRIGIYRNAAISGTAHMWFDGYTVATGRGTAESSAF